MFVALYKLMLAVVLNFKLILKRTIYGIKCVQHCFYNMYACLYAVTTGPFCGKACLCLVPTKLLHNALVFVALCTV